MTSTLIQLIDKQAADNPRAEAVRWQQQTLSYAELIEQSDRVARGLANQGISTNSRVGLSLGRGLDLAVGLLGIYRAGAAYVPLDPIYPRQRLVAMLRKAEVDLVVADDESPIKLTDGVALTPVADLQNRQNAAQAAMAIKTSSSGYVIFTSGSTGTPKGVVLGRRALENLVRWQASLPTLGQATRVLQFTPTSFDVHFQEFFGTWATGGTLVMVDDDTRRDPQQLAAFLAQQSIGRLFLPFVALRQLADVVVRSNLALPDLKDIVTAGEQLVVTDNLRRMFQALPQCRLHNHYGPSETHVATAYQLPATVNDWEELPAIGQAIANAATVIRTSSGAAAAEDEEGELYLGGHCVAEGYVGEPELTDERFVELPGESGRFYRTGDLVSRDSSGNLHYRGRADKQIKIRGYRVEVGEIEAQLNQDDDIRDSAVVAQETLGGDKRLIAYLVPGLRPQTLADANGSALDEWRQVWDHTYSNGAQDGADVVQLAPDIDPKFDIRGWNSSYSGEPLGEPSMREWVSGTRNRILALNPQRVLEVGAGTGLILFAVESDVVQYHALDYSATAIRQLQQTLSQDPTSFAHCRASCATAHDLSAFAADGYDTIVINSVTQHFESTLYLDQVLSQALKLLPAGGSVFLGDITAHRTRELFFAGVEAARGGDDQNDRTLTQRVAKRLAEDRELTLDAEFFCAWAQRQPRVKSLIVQLKPGSANTELTNFRFDVTLQVAAEGAQVTEGASNTGSPTTIDCRRWSASDSVTSLQTALQSRSSSQPWALRIEGIPNSRLQASKAHWLRLAGIQDSQATEDRAGQPAAIQPDALIELAKQMHVHVQTFFGEPGTLTAVFSSIPMTGEALLKSNQRSLDPESFASRPYLAGAFPAIVKRIRRSLENRLPDYMLPGRYVLLQALPLTPSGKLDRLRLPEPSSARPDLAAAYVAPTSNREVQLAAIWQQVLELDQVGVLDNFFDLGGTSILSLQLVNEISSQLDCNLTIVQLFEFPTIRGLCEAMEQTVKSAAGVNKAQQRARKQQQALAQKRNARNLRNRSRAR